MMRWTLVVLSVVACAQDGEILSGSDGVGSVKQAAMLEGVRVTWYTLVTEESTSGQHSGDSSLLCDSNGLTGCYHREFLCSGWGVAMQGTGISENGEYVKWMSGGGGWTPGYRELQNCASARFSIVNRVTGSSNRELIDDYSIAVDPAIIPLGWYVWIDSEGHWFRADDTGGAIDGRHVDIYRGLGSDTVTADHSRVFTTAAVRDYDDPSPYGGGGGTAGGGGGGTAPPGPNSCTYAFDHQCDEANGTNVCAAGSDTYDCTWYPPGGTTQAGPNSCSYAFDQECDHPGGTGVCPAGTDTYDCTFYPPGGGGTAPTGGPNSCTWAYDQECDEPGGTGLCPLGTDNYDCTSTGSNPQDPNRCYWAFDRVCDEPHGTGACSAGTDTWDCSYFPPSGGSPTPETACTFEGQRIDFMGKCDDGRVVWCNEYGTLEIIDCAPRRCDWVNNTIGHDCVN